MFSVVHLLHVFFPSYLVDARFEILIRITNPGELPVFQGPYMVMECHEIIDDHDLPAKLSTY